MRRHPHLYEINALLFVNRLSAKYSQKLSLATIPDSEWEYLARLGFDFVWMMGVWKRSPESKRLALTETGLRQEFDRIVPGWATTDVSGSPYAVYDYSLDPALGKPDDLLVLRDKLNSLGTGLILDFIPNHFAIDHPWTLSHPERFVQGSPGDVEEHPDWFFPSQGRYLAHGRDPYFAAWNDTVQVNFQSADMRDALTSELVRIAGFCDGLRCDMAMLALNQVFEWVWGGIENASSAPRGEFWELAIPRVRKGRGDFLLMAEVYWGLDSRLQQLGFDFTYDKPLYDHLRWDRAAEIRQHVREEKDRLSRQVHFTENHDEPRAAAALGRERSMAAAVILQTIPGLRFYQDGQLEGKTERVPVQFGREPFEFADPEIGLFYRRLLQIGDARVLHSGEWDLVEVTKSWEGNASYANIASWRWRLDGEAVIVAINYSPSRSQAWLKVDSPSRADAKITFQDVLTGTTYLRQPQELASKGLYVDLGPYQCHIMHAASY